MGSNTTRVMLLHSSLMLLQRTIHIELRKEKNIDKREPTISKIQDNSNLIELYNSLRKVFLAMIKSRYINCVINLLGIV